MIKNVILAFMLVVMPLSVVWADSLDEQLLRAAQNNDLERMQKLVKFGADVNAKDNGGWGKGATALMYATKSGKFNMVKWLVENGADVNAVNNYKWNAIMYMTEQGSFEEEQLKVTKYLVSQGIDIHAKDKDNNNVFMILVKRYKWEIAKFLVEQGADINIKDKDGNTALMWVINNSYSPLDKVQYLVSKGADVNIKNNDDKTAFMIALDKGKLEVAEFLESVGADTTRE